MFTRHPLRGFLLVFIDERPGHGYDLVGRLEPFGFDRSNPGRIYRALHWLEEAGLAKPGWDVDGLGPARRIYTLTTAGRHALEMSTPALRRLAGELDDPALASYLVSRLRTLGTGRQEFEFTMEVRLSVRARDEEVARRKLQRTLDRPRALGADVRVEAAVRAASAG